ncbi:butyrate kinase [Siculibacillus lacustris]|uniref:Probable butyrate kinase n=1 Tax=Siculibacillus lacustris TaxID=1549641 RepID=A0A4Q9VSX5_9HYPH|nr:butyrate kinase [Siculibacillus lacustris]TBW38995.1 butyrate kinase [Siculibacillus lacustris]
MAEARRILVINPGSTSTKVAVYEDTREIFRVSLEHRAEDLATYPTVAAQYEMRRSAVLDALAEAGIAVETLDAIAARGAALPPPLEGGAYRIDDAMVEILCRRPVIEHASNVAAPIAHDLARRLGIPAYIYDSVVADERDPIARLSGLKELPRISLSHVLNMRAQAIKAAEQIGRPYRDLTLIVTHLGGGISSSLHRGGRMIDNVSEDEGPFSPERAGRVPRRWLIDLCYAGTHDHATLRRMLYGRGGLVSYLGTSSAVEVERRIAAGDVEAELVYRAMAQQIAKSIGELATVVAGSVDAIVLTGGIAHSALLTGWIAERVSFLAPVLVLPGENELESLAHGVLRVLSGREPAKDYAPPCPA